MTVFCMRLVQPVPEDSQTEMQVLHIMTAHILME